MKTVMLEPSVQQYYIRHDNIEAIYKKLQENRDTVSCSFQKWNFVCEQKWTGLKDRAMKQDDGFGIGLGRLAEVIDVAIWTQAADDR